MMTKLNPVIFLVLLISCGGGDATTPQFTPTDICSPNKTTHTAIDTNSIKVSVEKVTHAVDLSQRSVPAENVLVQLDNQGPCMRTNKDGFVTFTALTNEPHDIHIFAPKGHQWISEYTVSPGKLKKYNIGADSRSALTQTSYSTLTGSVTNQNPGSLIDILVYPPNSREQKYSAAISPETSTYSIDLNFEASPGLTLTTDIIFLEYQDNPSTGESFIIDTKVFNAFEITTAATKNTSFRTLDVNFTIPIPKQQRSTLLSFNGILLPLDLGLSSLNVTSYSQPGISTSSTPFFSLYNQRFNQDIPSLDLSLPIVFKAYDQFKVGSYQLELNANPLNGNSNLKWRYYRVYPTSTTPYTITPKISTFPNIDTDQSGDTIYWNTVNQNLTHQYLYFYSKKGKATWLVTLNPSTTSVTLPTIPKGISTRLFSKQKFELIGQIKSSTTSELEEYRLNDSSWTPQ